MGNCCSCWICCKTCQCPQNDDFAIDRRKRLNEYGTFVENHASSSDSSPVKITTQFVERPDGRQLFTKFFEPKDTSKTKAMIFFLIKLGDHTEWFFHDVGYQYALLGYAVFMFDYIGHGRSDGLFAYIPNFQINMVNECISMFDYAKNKYIKSNTIYQNKIDKNNNYFLAGISMGGAIAISIALKKKDINNKLKGMVIVAPMCKVNEKVTPGKCMIWCMINCLLPCCPKARFVNNPLQHTLTKDEKIQEIHDKNPVMYYHRLSLQTGYEILKVTQMIETDGKNVTLPFWIAHGTDDILTNPENSQLFYNDAKSEDKEIKYYDGKGHLLYEEANEEIYYDTDKWMSKRITFDDMDAEIHNADSDNDEKSPLIT